MSTIDPIDRDLLPPPRAAELEARVRAAIGDVRPVKPLAPPAARAAIVAFVGLGVVTALAHPVADAQPRQVGALALVILAALGSYVVMRLAVPGGATMRTLGFWLAIPVLFSVRVLTQFGVEGGVHGSACLVIGSGVAVLPLVASGVLVARGYALRPALTGAIAGVSAGAFGLALLTLNCPVAEGPHLAVFHGGVLFLSAAVGALAGLLFQPALRLGADAPRR